jgi:hypothetical protein
MFAARLAVAILRKRWIKSASTTMYATTPIPKYANPSDALKISGLAIASATPPTTEIGRGCNTTQIHANGIDFRCAATPSWELEGIRPRAVKRMRTQLVKNRLKTAEAKKPPSRSHVSVINRSISPSLPHQHATTSLPRLSDVKFEREAKLQGVRCAAANSNVPRTAPGRLHAMVDRPGADSYPTADLLDTNNRPARAIAVVGERPMSPTRSQSVGAEGSGD